MTPLALLAAQVTSSFVVVGLFCAWVVAPRLATASEERALASLLWAHAFRYVPLALFAPGQTAPDVSPLVVRTIAWGDFAACVMAIVALVALHLRGKRALPVVWAFSVVSAADIVVALATGLGSGVHEHPLGVGWYVLTLYVPVVCVTQAMIIARLASGARRAGA